MSLIFTKFSLAIVVLLAIQKVSALDNSIPITSMVQTEELFKTLRDGTPGTGIKPPTTSDPNSIKQFFQLICTMIELDKVKDDDLNRICRAVNSGLMSKPALQVILFTVLMSIIVKFV